MQKLETITKLCQFKRVLLMYFISENEIIHILMYFIETRQLGLVQELAKYGNATKKGRTSIKVCSNTKLPLGDLNKLMKTQSSEIFSLILRELIAIMCS